jgi:hypothetical protein
VHGYSLMSATENARICRDGIERAPGSVEVGIGHHDVADGLGSTEAGGGGAPADELAWRGPLGDMLPSSAMLVRS